MEPVEQIPTWSLTIWEDLFDVNCIEALAEHVPEVRDAVNALKVVYMRFSAEQAVLGKVESISNVITGFVKSRQLLEHRAKRELVRDTFSKFVEEFNLCGSSKLTTCTDHELILASLQHFQVELSTVLETVRYEQLVHQRDQQCQNIAVKNGNSYDMKNISFKRIASPRLIRDRFTELERTVENEPDAGAEIINDSRYISFHRITSPRLIQERFNELERKGENELDAGEEVELKEMELAEHDENEIVDSVSNDLIHQDKEQDEDAVQARGIKQTHPD